MNYDIPNIFLESFGIKVSKSYDPKVGSGHPDDPKGIYSGLEFVDEEEASRLSALGTPVIFPITFLGGMYKQFSSTGKIEDIRLGDFDLPATCIIDFQRPKTIVSTRASGGYGTVKEIYAFDDWRISIKGFFLPQKNQPQGLTSAMAQELEMNKWNNLVSAIDVECALFQNREINSITISDFAVSGERGRPKLRPFTLTATSDEALELILTK